jgi:hypothetical protein
MKPGSASFLRKQGIVSPAHWPLETLNRSVESPWSSRGRSGISRGTATRRLTTAQESASRSRSKARAANEGYGSSVSLRTPIPVSSQSYWFIDLARIFHTDSIATDDTLAVERRAPSRELDVVSATPSLPLSPRAAPQRRLVGLATNQYEMSGLGFPVHGPHYAAFANETRARIPSATRLN